MSSAEPTAVELGDYLGIIRRRYLVVGGSVLVCLILGLVYGLSRPDVYRSTAEIALPSPESAQTPAQAVEDVQTELAVLQSDLVASRAAEHIDGAGDPRDLLSHLTAEAPPDSRVLVITYTAATAAKAQEGAQAFADGYIAQKEAEQREAIDEEAATYDEQIATVEEGIAEQQEIIDTADEDSREFARAEDARDRLADTLTQLQADRTSVEATRVDGGTIITPARLPRQPKAQGLGRTIAASIAAGLVIGLAAAFVLDRLDNRVRGAADLELLLGVPTLGGIPAFDAKYSSPPMSLVTVNAPASKEANAFRELRSAVLLALGGARTVAITSSVADEGKSTVAANLAVALALGGKRVALISADMRRPGVELLFRLDAHPGLPDVMSGAATIDKVEHRDLVDTRILTDRWWKDTNDRPGELRVVTGGTSLRSTPGATSDDRDDPADLLASSQFQDAIAAFSQDVDIAIFDTPPVTVVADATNLAPRLDATLLVVSGVNDGTGSGWRGWRRRRSRVREGTTLDTVDTAAAALRRAGATLIGTVVNNDADASRRASGTDAYRSHRP